MGFSLSPDTTAQSSDAMMEHQHCWQVLGTHHLCLCWRQKPAGDTSETFSSVLSTFWCSSISPLLKSLQTGFAIKVSNKENEVAMHFLGRTKCWAIKQCRTSIIAVHIFNIARSTVDHSLFFVCVTMVLHKALYWPTFSSVSQERCCLVGNRCTRINKNLPFLIFKINVIFKY